MCSESFPDCVECKDDDGDEDIELGECFMCGSGKALKDDESACIGELPVRFSGSKLLSTLTLLAPALKNFICEGAKGIKYSFVQTCLSPGPTGLPYVHMPDVLNGFQSIPQLSPGCRTVLFPWPYPCMVQRREPDIKNTETRLFSFLANTACTDTNCNKCFDPKPECTTCNADKDIIKNGYECDGELY